MIIDFRRILSLKKKPNMITDFSPWTVFVEKRKKIFLYFKSRTVTFFPSRHSSCVVSNNKLDTFSTGDITEGLTFYDQL